MFVTIKSLVSLIDQRLKWLEEGVASKSSHPEDVYNNWLEDITRSLNGSLKELKRLSSNDRLVSQYENKISTALQKSKEVN